MILFYLRVDSRRFFCYFKFYDFFIEYVYIFYGFFWLIFFWWFFVIDFFIFIDVVELVYYMEGFYFNGGRVVG